MSSNDSDADEVNLRKYLYSRKSSVDQPGSKDSNLFPFFKIFIINILETRERPIFSQENNAEMTHMSINRRKKLESAKFDMTLDPKGMLYE